MFVSASAGGITAVSTGIGEAVQQVLRKPAGPFTQKPLPPFLGSNPARDAKTRGGVWTAQSLRDAEIDATPVEASIDPLFVIMKPMFVSTVAGATYPWEESSDSSGGSVNTNNGNKLTAVPLVSWTARGGLPVNFTLFHNSEDNFSTEFGKGWSWSYNIYINTAGSGPTVHWGDGLSIPYTTSGSTYVPPAGIYDSLVHNVGGTWTLTKKSGIKFQFNSSGFLTAIQDRNGNQITFTLGSGNFCTAITDPSGRQITFTVTSGKYTSMTDPLGRTWSFTRNGSDCLSTVTWPILDGNTYTDGFTYDASARILTHTDRRGKVWSSTYTTGGALASETDPLSHTKTYTYSGSSTTVTDPLSHTNVYNYSSGILASEQDESGFATSYTSRDSNHNPLTIVDRRGKSWTRTFDSSGNVLTETDPLSHTTTYTYNGFSQVLTTTDALSHTTTNAYDANGNLLSVTDPLGHAKDTNTYDAYGQMVTSKDALNHTYTATRDSDGNVTTVADPLSHTMTMTYDGLGFLTSRTDALSHTESVAYDNWSRPVTYTHPDASTVTQSYNAVGAMLSSTDELSHATTYAYDNAGRLTSVTNANSETESYGYDNADHRTTVTNGRGKVSTYTVTNRGEVATLTLPDSSVESWSYDGEGNNTAYTNALSQTILYTYDDAGRHTAVDYPAGTDTAIAYDNADRRTSMTDGTGTTSWSYDNADRQTGLNTPQGNISYTYDNADRRATMTDSTGTTTYTLDNADNVTSLQNPFSETTSWTYDNADRVTRQTFSSGQYDDFGYDSRDRQTSVSHMTSGGGTLIQGESYVYDYAGNVTSKTVGPTTTTYTYDAIDQLLSESRTGYAASYTYDGNGNRTSKTVGGVTDTYTVDDADKLTTVKQGATTVKSFGYDTAGRTTSVVTSAGTTTLSYDYEDRITGITYPSSATNSFTYNGLDTRVGKVDSTGTATYRRDGASATDSVLSDGSATYTPGISERRGSTTLFDLQDQLGSFTRQTNTSGTTTATKTYDAYGMLQSSTGTPKGPFGFAGAYGYQEDPDSGLQLLGHRYYDPSTGRFLTRDPDRDGRNLYGYCDNNPISAVDPTGMFLQQVGPGETAAERGRDTIGNGSGPADCGDFVSDCYNGVYPAPPRDKSANEFPGWFRKHKDKWEQVPNDKNYKPKPGDVLVTQRKKGHGHVRMVGVDENGKPIFIDASIGYEKPAKDKHGKPIKGKNGKPVMISVPPRKPGKSSTQKPRGGETIWRPKPKK